MTKTLISTLISWSGGKDSALMLAELADPAGRGAGAPAGLLTAFVKGGDGERASAHGVRREWIERQAAAVGLPLDALVLPPAPPRPGCTASPSAPSSWRT